MKTILVFFTFVAITVAQDSPVNIHGFVDFYYAYDFNKPASMNRSYTTQPLRHNEFNLNVGAIGLTYTDEYIRGNFSLHTGTYVQSNFAAEPPLFKNIFEASVGTKLGNIWIDAGIFPSHIGLEGILSKDNWTYSRSLAADYSPYFETGLRISSQLSEHFTAGLLVLNGWQNIQETNSNKSIGTFLRYTPIENTIVNWSTFVGNEAADSLPSQLRIFNDFYYQTQLTSNLQTAALFDIGIQRNGQHTGWDYWFTAYAMMKYAFSSLFAAAVRIEYFSDKDGIIISTGTPLNFQTLGASLNFDYSPFERVLWRVEARFLSSKDEIFPSKNNMKTTNAFIVFSGAITI